jgi:thiol-disulfide isomerase/thioredoxin/sugar lactone lactonase YvrE
MSEAPTPPAVRPSSRRYLWLLPVLLLVAVFAALFGVVVVNRHTMPLTAAAPPADDDAPTPPKAKGRRPAPELDGGSGWLNTASPVKLKDLRGKIVVLDFWTFCCINCIHTLPDLAKLEKKYANQIVVVGVHSAKFDAEKDSENIRKAVLRYEISHPVVNDAHMNIWNAYEASSWPTLVLIDSEGNLVARGAGEGLYEALDAQIARLIKEGRDKKTLNEKPIKFELARFSETAASPLFFPGKVLADEASKRLFISDSTHHRIVITTLDGRKIAIAGNGQSGTADGPFDRACFNDPQGLALDGDTLYVADRKNNLIRALDLKAQTVKTVAGTGEQGEDRDSEGPALKESLNSPWALTLHDGKLYIAMAGFHQIWKMDLKQGTAGPYAGTGMETRRDGSLTSAAFAQPSGLTTDGKTLFTTDSETSSVRAVPLDGKGNVSTIVGQGLFDFGDVDGTGEAVRLQHALGLVYHEGKLYVADTYNSKIKMIDPVKRTSTTFLGGEAEGWLGTPVFREPGGISYANGKLYVADTNAHRIRVVDLKTKAVSTLTLQGVTAPKPAP